MPRTEETGRAGGNQRRRKYQDEDQTIFEALSRDHRTVSSILQQIEADPQDVEQVRGLFLVLKNELLAHSYAEDEVVYERLVETEDEQLTDLIEKARAEHSAIEELLSEMEGMAPSATEWSARLGSLRDMIEQHVREEEGEVFERASEVIGGDEQRELAHEFHAAKEQIAFETSPQLDEEEEEHEEYESAAGAGDESQLGEPDDVGEVRTSGTSVDAEPDSLGPDWSGGRSRGNTPID